VIASGERDHKWRTLTVLDVFLTADVEVWCDGWTDLDRTFPDAFQRYIYGPQGKFGLPHQLAILAEHGLVGVFFVEPLFATRFGLGPLAEIVGLLQDQGQEVQLHLHPEWVSESPNPILTNSKPREQFLHSFSVEHQTILIAEGLRLIKQAGATRINAFRAGNFGFNKDTLSALSANGICFDTSYNARVHGVEGSLEPGTILVEPVRCAEVFEYPVTVFNDGTSLLRPTQLTACSYWEIEGLLWQALALGRKSFVLLFHNFELLNQTRNRPDYVVVKRFERICRFLGQHRGYFRVRGFQGLEGAAVTQQPVPLTSPVWKTGLRIVEQTLRWRYA
jgi:hypothetical protein